MSLKKILLDQDPLLRKKSHLVTAFDERLHSLLDDMIETLDHAGGVGLAAPQIGILRRCVLVLDEKDQVIELVNPIQIESSEEMQDGAEGCLSVPGKWGYVERPMWVRVRAKDRYGKEFEVEGEGLMARCFCHELDHLDGHLFTKYVDHLYTQEELDQLEAKKKKEK